MAVPVAMQRNVNVSLVSSVPSKSLFGSSRKGAFIRSSRPSQRRSTAVIRATQESPKMTNTDAEELKKLSSKLGLPTDEGLFGFKPFAEIWVGRLAMGGFVSSLVVEFATGRGTLQQLGLITPSWPLFITLLILTGSATTIASWRTILRASNNELTANELVRYRQLLGIQNENKNIEDARKSGNPADKFLGGSDDTNAQSTKGADLEESKAPETATGVPKYTSNDLVTDKNFANEGLAYARDVEINQGRWAMLGFLAALLVEAGTGKGIIGQVIIYLKLSGLLGEKSGF